MTDQLSRSLVYDQQQDMCHSMNLQAAALEIKVLRQQLSSAHVRIKELLSTQTSVQQQSQMRMTRSRSLYGLQNTDRLLKFEASVNQVDNKIKSLTQKILANQKQKKSLRETNALIIQQNEDLLTENKILENNLPIIGLMLLIIHESFQAIQNQRSCGRIMSAIIRSTTNNKNKNLKKFFNKIIICKRFIKILQNFKQQSHQQQKVFSKSSFQNVLLGKIVRNVLSKQHIKKQQIFQIMRQGRDTKRILRKLLLILKWQKIRYKQYNIQSNQQNCQQSIRTNQQINALKCRLSKLQHMLQIILGQRTTNGLSFINHKVK